MTRFRPELRCRPYDRMPTVYSGKRTNSRIPPETFKVTAEWQGGAQGPFSVDSVLTLWRRRTFRIYYGASIHLEQPVHSPIVEAAVAGRDENAYTQHHMERASSSMLPHSGTLD